MTEILLLLTAAINALLLVDPFYGGGLTKATLAKGLVYLLGYGSLLFHFLGRAVTAPQRFRAACAEALRAWWPLIVLSIFVMTGSAYARWIDGTRETFLNMGLGMLFLPMMAIAVRSSEKPMLLLKWFAGLYVLTIAGVLAVLLSGGHTFHESIFIAIPLAVYLACSRRFSVWRTGVALALLAACLFSFKNTTFLLVLATLVLCGLVWWRRQLQGVDPIAVTLGMLFLVPLVVAAAGGLAWGWWSHRDALPSGNIEYRTEMYGIAWRMFLDSPIWGTAFTEPSVVYFSLYKIDLGTQYLPTHSDLLDLLAHGGVFAFVLWAMTVWRLGTVGMSVVGKLAARPDGVDLRHWQWLGVLLMIQVGALITYVINPVLVSPVFAYWIWGSAGFFWALHRELTAPGLPVPARHGFVARRFAV